MFFIKKYDIIYIQKLRGEKKKGEHIATMKYHELDKQDKDLFAKDFLKTFLIEIGRCLLAGGSVTLIIVLLCFILHYIYLRIEKNWSFFETFFYFYVIFFWCKSLYNQNLLIIVCYSLV